MKKHLRLMFVAGMAAMLVGVGAKQPASAFNFTYTTGFQVQNLEASVASISVTFYNPNGTAVVPALSDTIPANGSKTYFPLTSVAEGFNGSAVISADKQVAAVVNVIDNTGKAGASYIGFSSGATAVNLPLLFKSYFSNDSWFKVQNAGASNANVTVTYSTGVVRNATVAPGAAFLFDQTTEAHPAGSVFSARVTSDQPIVATVVEESPSVMFAYNGFTSASNNPVMPLVNANYFGNITGMQIQNTGASSTNVTVSYTPSLVGSACTETQTIPAGQSKTFALYAFSVNSPGATSSTCAFGAQFVGAGRVTANSASQPLAVIVNQLNSTGGNNYGEAYGAFDPNAATNSLVMPLIMDRNYGYFTGFSVMNVGAGSTTVNCTFTGTPYTQNATLSPNQALTAIQLNAIGAGYVGSGTCTAGAGAKIVGVVNQVSNDPGAVGKDSLLVYEAINK